MPRWHHVRILMGILLALVMVCSSGARAATFTVNSTIDMSDVMPGDGLALTGTGVTSLRAAIEESNALAGADTIILPAGTYGVGASFLAVSTDITLTGAATATTIISGETTGNIFTVMVGGRFTLSGVTLTAGSGFMGGALVNTGTTTITNAQISSNVAMFQGGGINNNPGASLTLSNCTLNGNSGGIVNGGAISNAGTMNLTNCTISGNSTTGGVGGGIFNGGGLLIAGPRGFPAARCTLINCTITGNNTGGINAVPGTVASVGNTICALNTNGAARLDVSGPYTSLGGNLIGDVGTATGFMNGVNGDQVGGGATPLDPLIGPLANNGGPTTTHALLTGSPALDRALSAGAPVTDQRGTARPQGPAVDVGAFELAVVVIPPPPPNGPPVIGTPPFYTPNPAEVGATIDICVTATDPENNPLTYTWTFGDGTTATGACVTHIFVTPGTFSVTVTVSDGTNSVSATVNVPVGSRFGLLNLPIRILFDGQTGQDQYHIRGRLTLPGTFSPAVLEPGGVQASGRLVTLDVGGVVQVVQLDTRGKGSNAQGNFSMRRERRGTWIFKAFFKGGTFSPTWTDDQLVNGDFKRKLVFMPVTLTVSGVGPFAGLKPLQYTAERNAKGKTTNRR